MAQMGAKENGIRYRGTVRDFRDGVLPALRRVAMEGLVLRAAFRAVQARIDSKAGPARGGEAA